MAREMRALCDRCGTDTKVFMITVVYEPLKKPWEADLCESCYGEILGDVAKKSRPATKSNVRPQHKVEKLDPNKFSI